MIKLIDLEDQEIDIFRDHLKDDLETPQLDLACDMHHRAL